MNTIVEVEHIGIKFQDTVALKDVSFKVYEGEIFGFLGPSGAGKTTTIKLLTKQLRTGHGTIMLFGKPIQDLEREIYENIGILSDNSGYYEKMSVYDNLKLFADLQKIPSTVIDEVLRKTGLFDAKNKKAKNLSKGMKQRLLFSRAILNKPKILFLDEPTSSLDPATSEAVYEMILELKKQGTTIFLTTHNMLEADLLCDRVAFLHKGELVEIGNPNDLKLKHAEDEVYILSDKNEEYTIRRTKEALLETLQTMDGEILRIVSKEPSLKSIFLSITGREL